MTHSFTKPDPENMLDYIDALPEDLAKAWQLGQELPLPAYPQIERVVIAGMGGSAIGGDLLAAYLADQLTIPVVSHRNYDLPAWAKGKNTLVICSSHSGNTEETISSFNKAIDENCSLLVLCTGGRLQAEATAKGVPLWTFVHTGQPRTAIPYSFGLLLALFCRLGLAANTARGFGCKRRRSLLVLMDGQGRDLQDRSCSARQNLPKPETWCETWS